MYPPEEVARPEVETHGGHAGPDDCLVGQVEAVQVLGQDLHLAQWDSARVIHLNSARVGQWDNARVLVL